jgi:DNA oxidative demethylase
MSVATTSCGALGWVGDTSGYGYSAVDPISQLPWPPIPMLALCNWRKQPPAQPVLPIFCPDACLINQYQVGTKMGLHRDKDERDFTQPIVSVSLGVFRQDFSLGATSVAINRFRFYSVTVMSWYGVGPRARFYHGVNDRSSQWPAPFSWAHCACNLTFRKAALNPVILGLTYLIKPSLWL